MRLACALLAAAVAAVVFPAAVFMEECAAAAPSSKPSPASPGASQSWCVCLATPSFFNNCVTGCDAVFTNITVTPGECTPSCHNNLPCTIVASVTFQGSCSGGPFDLAAKPICDSYGEDVRRCPGDSAHGAGIGVGCGVCQFN
jgi:hypothetical protein